MPDIATIVTTVASSAVVSGLIAAAFKYYSDKKLAQEQASLNERLETWRTSPRNGTSPLSRLILN